MSFILIIALIGGYNGAVTLDHLNFQSHALCEEAAGALDAANQVRNANTDRPADLILLCEPDGGSDATN